MGKWARGACCGGAAPRQRLTVGNDDDQRRQRAATALPRADAWPRPGHATDARRPGQRRRGNAGWGDADRGDAGRGDVTHDRARPTAHGHTLAARRRTATPLSLTPRTRADARSRPGHATDAPVGATEAGYATDARTLLPEKRRPGRRADARPRPGHVKRSRVD